MLHHKRWAAPCIDASMLIRTSTHISNSHKHKNNHKNTSRIRTNTKISNSHKQTHTHISKSHKHKRFQARTSTSEHNNHLKFAQSTNISTSNCHGCNNFSSHSVFDCCDALALWAATCVVRCGVPRRSWADKTSKLRQDAGRQTSCEKAMLLCVHEIETVIATPMLIAAKAHVFSTIHCIISDHTRAAPTNMYEISPEMHAELRPVFLAI